MQNKEIIQQLKALEFEKQILESMYIHGLYNRLFCNLFPSESSFSIIKEYYSIFKLERDLKKLDKQIRKLERRKEK